MISLFYEIYDIYILDSTLCRLLAAKKLLIIQICNNPYISAVGDVVESFNPERIQN